LHAARQFCRQAVGNVAAKSDAAQFFDRNSALSLGFETAAQQAEGDVLPNGESESNKAPP
jgi:hypothetical protein